MAIDVKTSSGKLGHRAWRCCTLRPSMDMATNGPLKLLKLERSDAPSSLVKVNFAFFCKLIPPKEFASAFCDRRLEQTTLLPSAFSLIQLIAFSHPGPSWSSSPLMLERTLSVQAPSV